MKARIISTGEIIKIADYARVVLDQCDSYGNPIEVPFDDVELIKDSSDYRLAASPYTSSNSGYARNEISKYL